MTFCNHHEKANRDEMRVSPFATQRGQANNNQEHPHKKRPVMEKNNISDNVSRFQRTGGPIQPALPLLASKPRKSVPTLPSITTRGAIMECRRLDKSGIT
jgi:hypothetical protein